MQPLPADYDIAQNGDSFNAVGQMTVNHKEKPRHVWDSVDGEIIDVVVGRVYAQPAQKYLAKNLCDLLNRNYHHDGRWQVTLTDPSQTSKRMNGVFRPAVPETMLFSFYSGQVDDPTNKLCFDLILDEDFITIATMDPQHWLDKADEAATQWKEMFFTTMTHGDSQLVDEALATPMSAGEVIAPVDKTQAE